MYCFYFIFDETKISFKNINLTTPKLLNVSVYTSYKRVNEMSKTVKLGIFILNLK